MVSPWPTHVPLMALAPLGTTAMNSRDASPVPLPKLTEFTAHQTQIALLTTIVMSSISASQVLLDQTQSLMVPAIPTAHAQQDSTAMNLRDALMERPDPPVPFPTAPATPMAHARQDSTAMSLSVALMEHLDLLAQSPMVLAILMVLAQLVSTAMNSRGALMVLQDLPVPFPMVPATLMALAPLDSTAMNLRDASMVHLLKETV